MAEKCLQEAAQVEMTEKGSRFLAFAYPCPTLEAFRILAENLCQRFADASHVCFAFRIRDEAGLHIKCSDDGEPSGTAGRPILSHIEGRGLINTAVFVVRYFGGTKLGAGGLVRAYGNAAREAIEAAKLIDLIILDQIELSFGYDLKNKFDYQLSRHNGKVVEVSYSDQIWVKFEVPAESRRELFEDLGLDDPGIQEH